MPRPSPIARARMAAPAAAFAALAVLSGCAGDYVARSAGVRSAYEQYRHDEALARLDAIEKASSRQDRLVWLLDRAMVLHAAGRWEESLESLAAAERLADQLDIVSVSEEARTLLSDERERAYRGEDFELLLVNVLAALNYAALDDEEAALVEVRRANQRLERMVSEQKRPYQQLAVASYLGGVLWESAGEADSAYIDYTRALRRLQSERAAPDDALGQLAEPLLRLALETGRQDDLDRLRAVWPDVEAAPLSPGEGQVVVLVEAGRGPVKASTTQGDGGQAIAVPVFRPRAWARTQAVVTVDGRTRRAIPVTSLESVAQQHLEARLGALVARSLAATTVKAGVAAAVGAAAKDEGVGWLAFWLLMAGQQADLRSWLSLPAEFQLARFRLPAGEHEVAVDWAGGTTVHPVTVRAGEIALLSLRRY